MVSRTWFRISSACLTSLALLMAGEASGGYSIIDLGPTGPGASGVGNAVNGTGLVAGTITTGPNATVAERTVMGGSFTPVSFSGLGQAGASSANAINDAGQVAGSFRNAGDGVTHAFRTVNGAAVDLGSLDYHPTSDLTVAARETQAFGINGSGQVVGTATLVDGTSRAFRGDAGGGLAFLPTVGDGQFSQGKGINSGGQVVGTFEFLTGINHAFYTDANSNPVDVLTSYSARGFGASTYGTAINDSGALVGYGDFGQNSSHAFLAPALLGPKGPGKAPLIDLGVLNGYTSSYAYGINSSSQVVGKLDNFGSGGAAFIYDTTRGMFDLRSLLSSSDRDTWTSLTTANGINDRLQVTGQGVVGGQLHAFLMTPNPGESPFASPALVPAPPAFVLAGIGCGIAAIVPRLRRGRTGGRASA